MATEAPGAAQTPKTTDFRLLKNFKFPPKVQPRKRMAEISAVGLRARFLQQLEPQHEPPAIQRGCGGPSTKSRPPRNPTEPHYKRLTRPQAWPKLRLQLNFLTFGPNVAPKENQS